MQSTDSNLEFRLYVNLRLVKPHFTQSTAVNLEFKLKVIFKLLSCNRPLMFAVYYTNFYRAVYCCPWGFSILLAIAMVDIKRVTKRRQCQVPTRHLLTNVNKKTQKMKKNTNLYFETVSSGIVLSIIYC